jgi:hypothetical protein
MTRRIERGRRSFADNGEGEDATERKGATGHANKNSCNLQEAKLSGRD